MADQYTSRVSKIFERINNIQVIFITIPLIYNISTNLNINEIHPYIEQCRRGETNKDKDNFNGFSFL